MMRNHKLAQHISSASWSKFFDMLTYKSVCYGNEVVKVPTTYPSSQTCSCCGYKKSNGEKSGGLCMGVSRVSYHT